MTPLESFLALHFGLLLAFSALGLVVNVCDHSRSHLLHTHESNCFFFFFQIPFLSPADALQPDKKRPPTHPLIVPISSFSLLSAFLSYNTAGAGSLSLV